MSGRQQSGVGYRVTYKAVFSIALIAVGTAVAQTSPSASYNEYLRSQYGTQYVPGAEAQVVPQPAPQAVPQQVPQAPSQAAPQPAPQSVPQPAPLPVPQTPVQVAPQVEAVNPYGSAPVPQPQVQPEVQTVAAMSPAQLDTLLGPIALYPDPLLALVLAASTVPHEIAAADGLLRARGGQVIEAEIDAQPWTQAMKSLAREPGLVSWMASQRQWTDALAWAVTYQSGDLMATVQRLRLLARVNGSLVDTPQQRVAYGDGGAILILPVEPQVVYVPVYEPTVVFVATPVVYPQPVRFRPAFRPSHCPEVDWGRGRFSFEIGVSRGYGHPYHDRGHGERYYSDPYRPSPRPRWDDRDRDGRDRDDRYIPGRGDRVSDARTDGDSRGRGTVTLPPGSRRIDERPTPRDDQPRDEQPRNEPPREDRPRSSPRDDDRGTETRQEPRTERPSNPYAAPRAPTPLPDSGADDARRARDDERARNRGTSAGAPPAPPRVEPRAERPTPPAPRPVPTPRQEAPRQEAPRQEPRRQDPPRATPPSSEGRPQERERRRGTESPGGSSGGSPPPSAAPRQEAPRQEVPRQEAPRQEPPRQQAPRPSAPPSSGERQSDRDRERERNRGTTSERR